MARYMPSATRVAKVSTSRCYAALLHDLVSIEFDKVHSLALRFEKHFRALAIHTEYSILYRLHSLSPSVSSSTIDSNTVSVIEVDVFHYVLRTKLPIQGLLDCS